MIKDHKLLILLVLFNQMVSPELKLNSKLRALCKDPANAFNCTNPSEEKYILPSIIIEKVNEFLPIRLSKVNFSKLQSLSNILYRGMPKSGYFAALKASAERLKAQGVDGKRVIEIKPIYHSGEQLPGYLVILEDGSQKIITRVEYIQMIQPNERSKSSQAGIPARTARRTLGTLLPPTTERVNMVDSLPMEKIFRTVIVPIDSISILPLFEVSSTSLDIDNLQIINKEDRYKNLLSEEEIERYNKTKCCISNGRFTTLRNTNCL